MYWYDFGRNDVYIGTGGKVNLRKDFKTVSKEEFAKIDKLFGEHVVKIYYNDSFGYDSSDDDRAGESYSSHDSYVYRYVNLDRDLYGVVVHNGEVVGISFFVNNDRGDARAEVFYFSGKPRNSMTLGYSASHSSSYTTVTHVELVKKGENGAPEEANKELNFIQHMRYPEL